MGKAIILLCYLFVTTSAFSQEWETFWATGAYKYSIKKLDNTKEKEYLKEAKSNDSTVEIYKRVLFKYEKPKEVAQKEITRFVKSAQKKGNKRLVEAYNDYAYIVYEINYICTPNMYKLLKIYHYNTNNEIINSIDLTKKLSWKKAKNNSPLDTVVKYSCATDN
ncbi:hypothetical protein J2Q11_12955 [Tenacibaculum finnmarkense genomovar finnmarkense]|uniref:hypothetical protein n=1 Tax=Tenacibaculum finnmarkense TaxID=2781243 RepID=UPI001E3B67D3|nr:hypothetical protein [Tenacibaculum finnmarkense]MCD8418558.1 hypothetical protein [Tenacibaculum finnmarkense genomovar finnmarkense]MCD8455140.1 hypothetical protein [Tenacibaculum finnmarkense genomovar ulcerans]MCG8186916.1 hypothetical protein [Tenacibaculum finnmarkense genomovar finnmarkense]MCG8203462.1 hypothetical protein [Tenacibaculum finnmarkense genomovar finnmarkense]MCG8210925.1 hypothetical protein [Tenacibaculum finnmarkense genomovar finnmarkense]